MNSETFSAEFGEKAKEMRRHPIELNALSSNVLAITGQKQKFYLQKRRKNKVQIIAERNSPEDVQVQDISFLLDVLRVELPSG